MTLELPLLDVFGRGGSLKSSLVRRLPAKSRLPDAGRPLPPGRLDLEGFVSERIGIDEIPEAFERMESGDVALSVVVL